MNKNNHAVIYGTVISPYYYKCIKDDKRCLTVYVEAVRLSGEVDTIPVMVSEDLVDSAGDDTGRQVMVNGAVHSRNWHDGKKGRLDVFIEAEEMAFDMPKLDHIDSCSVSLNGYLIKAPIYRKTPVSKKDITDLLIGVRREDNSYTDHIPSIAWHENAIAASILEKGTPVTVTGRFQSREYKKRLSDGSQNHEKRIAYELSIDNIHITA